MLLQKEHTPPCPGEHVCRSESTQPAADDHDVVFILRVFEKVPGHCLVLHDRVWRLNVPYPGQVRKQCRFAMAMPLVMLPMMPTKPWSVPQMKRFLRWVVPSSCLSGAP